MRKRRSWNSFAGSHLLFGKAANTARELSCCSAMCAFRNTSSCARNVSTDKLDRCHSHGLRSTTTDRWEGSMGNSRPLSVCLLSSAEHGRDPSYQFWPIIVRSESPSRAPVTNTLSALAVTMPVATLFPV